MDHLFMGQGWFTANCFPAVYCAGKAGKWESVIFPCASLSLLECIKMPWRRVLYDSVKLLFTAKPVSMALCCKSRNMKLAPLFRLL